MVSWIVYSVVIALCFGIAANAAEQHAAIREWKWRHHGAAQPNLAVFVREILPGLQRVTLGTMAGATRLSRAYCGRIRQGQAVPHARHWEVQRRVA